MSQDKTVGVYTRITSCLFITCILRMESTAVSRRESSVPFCGCNAAVTVSQLCRHGLFSGAVTVLSKFRELMEGTYGYIKFCLSMTHRTNLQPDKIIKRVVVIAIIILLKIK